jgi:hypothetical protein
MTEYDSMGWPLVARWEWIWTMVQATENFGEGIGLWLSRMTRVGVRWRIITTNPLMSLCDSSLRVVISTKL